MSGASEGGRSDDEFECNGLIYTRDRRYERGWFDGDEGPFRVLYWQWGYRHYLDFESLERARRWCEWASEWFDGETCYAAPQTIIDTRNGEEHDVHG